MELAHRRHDISDRVWERIRDHLPGGLGKIGRPSYDIGGFVVGMIVGYGKIF